MAANDEDLVPAELMRSALLAAGVPPENVRIKPPTEEHDSDVHVLGPGGIIVVIQCGRDKEGIYFIADHWYASGECYCLTPAHIPNDAAKVTVAVVRYLNNPKHETQSLDVKWNEEP